MPYCEDCAKYWTPSAMNADGTCPSCGRVVEAPQRQSTVTAKNLDLKQLAVGADGDVDDVKAPWHFKLLMVLLVAYLGWRIVDLFV
ncbi:MAG: hypothetical protein KDB40_08540 [Acidimicrobiales bacterium]|nr:hypothetical protein [Acidimicrobiales bacterium]MCB9393920.1 hypothetical protein [Acidimicrobiaceae bacterium]